MCKKNKTEQIPSNNGFKYWSIKYQINLYDKLVKILKNNLNSVYNVSYKINNN